MKSPEKIRKMFDSIATKYDFMNNVISFGLHLPIKKYAVSKIKLGENSKVLDLCCGTGDISNLIAKKKEVSKVVGTDFSSKMIEIAQNKNLNKNKSLRVDKKIEYVVADCTNLPFENSSFDCATIFFGLRNIKDENLALNEINRVLKPHGQLVYMDFSNHSWLLNFIFDFFLKLSVKIFYPKNQMAYEYLIKSKKEYYSSKELPQVFKKYGFTLKTEYNFLFGCIFMQIFQKDK